MKVQVISLTTDFGLCDGYVGQMKAVIFSTAPQVQVVDISHLIEPQEVLSGAILLEDSYSFFPEGTVHVAVVDPGVGGDRRAIAVRSGPYVFIGPDNGLLVPAAEAASESPDAFEIANPGFTREHVSRTFHGRDVFAPAAAALAAGERIEDIGPRIDFSDLVRIDYPRPEAGSNTVIGTVLRADRFGNLITNIRECDFGDVLKGTFTVEILGSSITGPAGSYDSVGRGELLALWGSSGRLEISVRQGSAAAELGAGKGVQVKVVK